MGKIRPTFAIGDWVTGNMIRAPENRRDGHNNTYREIRGRVVPRFEGQVIGAVFRQEGEVIHGWGGEQGYLKRERTVMLIQVRLGYSNSPIECYESDLAWTVVPAGKRVPFKVGNNWVPDWLREELRKDCPNWPRDEKGRWKKL